jgi:hypothetical protein
MWQVSKIKKFDICGVAKCFWLMISYSLEFILAGFCSFYDAKDAISSQWIIYHRKGNLIGFKFMQLNCSSDNKKWCSTAFAVVIFYEIRFIGKASAVSYRNTKEKNRSRGELPCLAHLASAPSQIPISCKCTRQQ